MKTVGKVVIGVAAYIIGVVVTGVVTSLLHLPVMDGPPGVSQQAAFAAFVFGTTLLVAGMTPLVVGLGGSRLRRIAALFVLVFGSVTMNTMIEAAIFTTWIKGGVALECARYILPVLMLSTAFALLFKSAGEPLRLPKFSPTQWIWRIAVAWVAFPVIYIAFGMCVGPFVTPAYLAGVGGLILPPMSVILKTQFLIRSPLFLLSSLPVIALWSGSRKRLFITFAIAEAIMVGIHGLVQAFWFPPLLRVLHSIEITADSFAYIAVLVWLFSAREAKAAEVKPELNVAPAH
ncbi:MAG TPA: hypothetical protein VF135_06855 [Terriglobales bacterium]